MFTTTQMKTISQFIAELNIKVDECLPLPLNPNNVTWTNANHYRVVLINAEEKKLIIPFSMGLGHTSPPKADNVLDCLASDALSLEGCENFHQWKESLGYESNHPALNIYQACKKQSEKLKEWLGTETYEALLYEVERM